MKLLRFFLILSFSVALIAFNSSCKKITEDQIVTGLWKVKGVYIGPSQDNYLNQLPGYTNGGDCCTYKLDFERDGLAFSYYVVNNSIQNFSAGVWYLNAHNEIYIKVDNFIDGTFDIAKPTLKHWKLTTDYNHIAAFDSLNPQLDTTYTMIDMNKI